MDEEDKQQYTKWGMLLGIGVALVLVFAMAFYAGATVSCNNGGGLLLKEGALFTYKCIDKKASLNYCIISEEDNTLMKLRNPIIN